MKFSKRKIAILAAILLPTFASAGILAMVISKKEPEKPEPAKIEAPKAEKKPEAPKPKFYGELSGAEVSSKELVAAPVFGAMIENSPHSRPQSGLHEAEVVFEAVAEGGITRFLALYQQNKPQAIGPIRSLRSYYIDWLAGFDASVAHVGGSGDALARIRNGNYRDIDEFSNEWTFWRAQDRWAPHNVYTNFEKLSALSSVKGWNASNFKGFSRKEDSKSPTPNATQISVNLSGPLYNTSYNYSAECNCYARNQAGAAHTDREKGQISPKNVVALKIDMRLASDRLHNIYGSIGSGAGCVFRDGTAEEITWEKSSEKAPLILKNSKGEEVKLNRGQTWIAAVPSASGSISWK